MCMRISILQAWAFSASKMEQLDELRVSKATQLNMLGSFPSELKTALLHPKSLSAFRAKCAPAYLEKLMSYKKVLTTENPPMIAIVDKLVKSSLIFELPDFKEVETPNAKRARKSGL
jgi:hypothetical protein